MDAEEARERVEDSKRKQEKSSQEKRDIMYDYTMCLVQAESLVEATECAVSGDDFPFECEEHLDWLKLILRKKGYEVKEFPPEFVVGGHIILNVSWERN